MTYYQNLATFLYRSLFSKKAIFIFCLFSFSPLYAQNELTSHDSTIIVDLLVKAAKLERESRTNQNATLANSQKEQAKSLRKQAEDLKTKMSSSKTNSNPH